MDRRNFLKGILAASAASSVTPLSSFADGQPFCQILGRFVERWYSKMDGQPAAPPVVLPAEYPEIIDTLYSLAEKYPQAAKHWHSHAVDWPPPFQDDVLVLVGSENFVELGVRSTNGGHEVLTRAGRVTDGWTPNNGDLGPFIVTLALSSIMFSGKSARVYAEKEPPKVFDKAKRIWTGGRQQLWQDVWRNETVFYSHPDGYLLASEFFTFERGNGEVLPCYTYKAACHEQKQLQRLVNSGWKVNSLGSD